MCYSPRCPSSFFLALTRAWPFSISDFYPKVVGSTPTGPISDPRFLEPLFDRARPMRPRSPLESAEPVTTNAGRAISQAARGDRQQEAMRTRVLLIDDMEVTWEELGRLL